MKASLINATRKTNELWNVHSNRSLFNWWLGSGSSKRNNRRPLERMFQSVGDTHVARDLNSTFTIQLLKAARITISLPVDSEKDRPTFKNCLPAPIYLTSRTGGSFSNERSRGPSHVYLSPLKAKNPVSWCP